MCQRDSARADESGKLSGQTFARICVIERRMDETTLCSMGVCVCLQRPRLLSTITAASGHLGECMSRTLALLSSFLCFCATECGQRFCQMCPCLLFVCSRRSQCRKLHHSVLRLASTHSVCAAHSVAKLYHSLYWSPQSASMGAQQIDVSVYIYISLSLLEPTVSSMGATA